MKNKLCRINNVLTVVFTTFNCYLSFSTSKRLYISSEGKGTGVGQYKYEQVHTLTGNTAGRSGVAAETVELVQFPWGVCAFLFRAWFTLSSLSLRTKH